MSYEIVDKRDLNSEDYAITVRAPLVAKKFKAGNFVVFRVHQKGERIPMSVQKTDGDTITMFIKKLGKTSMELDTLKAGDTLENVIGPLGTPVESKLYGNVVFASDLVCGHAENYAACKELREKGNHVISIQTFPSKDMVYLEDELRSVSDEYYITTIDGSYGRKGTYLDVLKELLEDRKVDAVFAGGILGTYIKLAELTRAYNIPTMVTMRMIMVDGTGMCGSCRLEVGGETKFACVDGPMFDAHLVNFDLVMARNNRFLEEEALSKELYLKSAHKQENKIKASAS
jgi:ferredoxin/flavodoxin---NADP+ reductase